MKNIYGNASVKIRVAALLILGICLLSLEVLCQPTTGFASIVQQAGNADMKAYGSALEAGSLTPTVKAATIPAGAGTTYYVDATNGNDANSGTTTSTAWKSIDKVNTVTLQPGDRILFKAGETWTAPTAPKTNGSLPAAVDEDQDGRPENFLTPHGSGTQGASIVLGAYGTGALPKFVGGANVNTVVSFKDQEYWDISNIDVSNVDPGFNPSNPSSSTNAHLMGNLRGIQVYGQSHSDDGVTPGGVLDGFTIHDTFIHDICGHVYWGGSPADRGYPGVYGNMGNDASKRTGGIVFEIWRPTTESNLTDAQKAAGTMDRPITFNNIAMRNNVICNTSFGGITVKQWGGVGHPEVSVGDFYVAPVAATNENWYIPQGVRNATNGWYDPSDSNYHPHTNVFIENNYVSNNKTEYGCNTIRVASTNGGLLAHNLCNGAGTCGIEIDYANDIVVQYNEAYDTRRKMGGVDNNGIDFDQGTSNCLAQYNYLHGNGDGFLACGWNSFGTAVWRYNVVQNSGSGDFYLALYNTKGYNYFHNNLLYSTNNATSLVGRPGGFKVDYVDNPLYLFNNIFFSASTTTKPDIYDGTYSTYSNNSFFGPRVTRVAEDVNAVTENPGFTGNFTSDLNDLKITQYSPLINAGQVVTYPNTFGGIFAGAYLYNQDFYGNPASSGASPDIGLHEYQFTAGKGIIRGYVNDQNGTAVAGAIVKLQGTTLTATSQTNGYYNFGELPGGTYTLVATKQTYADGPAVQQTVAAGQAVNVALNLGAYLISTGKISGTVTISGGAAVAGAKLTLSRAGQVVDTTTSTTGQYSFRVPGFDTGAYTLLVSKFGYLDQRKNLLVRSGDSLTQRFILRSKNSTCLLDESFNGYATGTFNSNATWNASAAGGTITIVNDPAQSGNQYLRLNKTASGTIAVYNKLNANATGIVTIEARVMRTTDASSINQLGMYSYNATDFGSGSTIPPSTGRLATFAVNKSSTRDYLTHDGPGTPDAGDYTLSKWDTIRIVVNLNTKTFDFYVNDLITPTLTNKTLRTTNRNAIDKFLFYGNATNIGDLCIDYFRVCMETVDRVAPKVNLITRKAPLSTSGADTSVTYGVTFSEEVDGVDPSDFSLSTTGNLSGAVSSVTAVSASVYEVTVNNLAGEGNLRLDVKSTGTGIVDAAGNGLNGGFSTGDIYTRTKNAQTITFNALATQQVGNGNIVLSATASSNLVVRYGSSNPSVATVTGDTLRIVGAGTATITASQAGDNNYQPAVDVTQQLSVEKRGQSITFAALGQKTTEAADFDAGATASSILAIRYSSSNPAVATIVNGLIHVVGAGTTVITATQAGNFEYEAATPVTQQVVVIAADVIKLKFQDGGNGRVADNTIQPNLMLVNEGTTTIPYSELIVRYWFTAENFAGINSWVDYAQLGASSVRVRYVWSPQPRNGATGYVEYSFDASAGNLVAGGNSGSIQSRFSNADWSDLNETDDYSYQANSSYSYSDKITIYRQTAGGTPQLIWGTEPAVVNPLVSLRVYSQNRNNNSVGNTISTYLRIDNEGNQPVAYEDLSVRYWFTSEGSQSLNYWVDFAKLGSSNFNGQFVRNVGRSNADTYLEWTIKPTAGSLYPASSSGIIQSRITKSDWSDFNELNDYSYQPAAPMAANEHITVYYKNSLIYGTEPGSMAQRVAGGTATPLASATPSTSAIALQVRLLENPVSGALANIQIEGAENQPVTLELTSVTGSRILERTVNRTSSVEQQSFPLSTVPGMYLLRVSSLKESVVLKLLRQ